jgi:hypothetical protein
VTLNGYAYQRFDFKSIHAQQTRDAAEAAELGREEEGEAGRMTEEQIDAAERKATLQQQKQSEHAERERINSEQEQHDLEQMVASLPEAEQRAFQAFAEAEAEAQRGRPDRRGHAGGGESFLRVHWVAVPEKVRSRRVNRRLPRPSRDHAGEQQPHLPLRDQERSQRCAAGGVALSDAPRAAACEGQLG